jgi:hypothetical protein
VTQTISPIGAIGVITILNGGSNYAPVTGRVEVTHPTGTNFSGTVQVNNLGEVIGVTVGSGGIGYVDLLPAIIIDGVGGSGAQIQAAVSTVTGAVTGATIIKGGSGYPVTSTATVTPAALYAGIGGKLYLNTTLGVITSIIVTDPGYGYRSGLYELKEPTLGTSAHLYLTVNQAGEIQSVRVLSGGTSYATGIVDAAPIESGAGATATVTVIANPYGTNPYSYFEVVAGISSDQQKIDQVAQVINHFKMLGYAIKAEVNPSTGSTIQWYICW